MRTGHHLFHQAEHCGISLANRFLAEFCTTYLSEIIGLNSCCTNGKAPTRSFQIGWSRAPQPSDLKLSAPKRSRTSKSQKLPGFATGPATDRRQQGQSGKNRAPLRESLQMPKVFGDSDVPRLATT
jgi:hypothetical protein